MAKNIISILVEPLAGEAILPGDFLIVKGKRYPILSIKKQVGAMKIDIIAKEVPEELSIVELRRSFPKEGKAYIIGSKNDWFIAGLRLSGFEITSLSEDSDVIILTDPIHLPDISKPIVIAPSPTNGLQDFVRFNELLIKEGVSIVFNTSTPISVKEKEVIVKIPSLGMKCIIPSHLQVYPLKVTKNVFLLGYIERYGAFIALDPAKDIYVVGSSALFMPYDLLEEKGDNTKLLPAILKIRMEAVSTGKERLIVVAQQIGEIEIPFNKLNENELFERIIEYASLFGGLLKERNDFLHTASFVYQDNLTSQLIEFEIKVQTNRVILRCKSEEGSCAKILQTIKAIIETLIKLLREREEIRERFRKLILLVSEAQKRLITIKDMIELDMNPYTIMSDLRDLAGFLASEEHFGDVASEIMSTLKQLNSIVEESGRLSEESKKELLAKIDKWIISIRDHAANI